MRGAGHGVGMHEADAEREQGKESGRRGERGRSRPGTDGGTEGGPGAEAETDALGGAEGVEQHREIDSGGRDAGDNRERAREKRKRDGDRNTEADLI